METIFIVQCASQNLHSKMHPTATVRSDGLQFCSDIEIFQDWKNAFVIRVQIVPRRKVETFQDRSLKFPLLTNPMYCENHGPTKETRGPAVQCQGDRTGNRFKLCSKLQKTLLILIAQGTSQGLSSRWQIESIQKFAKRFKRLILDQLEGQLVVNHEFNKHFQHSCFWHPRPVHTGLESDRHHQSWSATDHYSFEFWTGHVWRKSEGQVCLFRLSWKLLSYEHTFWEGALAGSAYVSTVWNEYKPILLTSWIFSYARWCCCRMVGRRKRMLLFKYMTRTGGTR